MPRKVFTAGEVLAAADVNEFLADQAIMTFADSTARGSAIPTPVTGMYTHLEDSPQRTQFWNGSAWVSPFGATFINNTSFTSQTSVTVDNVFTSEFDHYKIFISCVGTTNAQLDLVLRAAGSDLASSDYQRQITRFANTSLTGERSSNGTAFIVGSTRNGTRTFADISLGDPFRTASTQCIANVVDPDGGITSQNQVGRFTPTTSSTGFKVSSSTFTGDIQVYGFRSL
jgi:hypothetical protein